MVSVFKKAKKEIADVDDVTIPMIDVAITEMFRGIKEGRWKKEIEHLRTITDEKKQREYKATNLMCFTVSGIFKKRKSEELISHSGFIAMDFDNFDNLNDVRAELYADKYTYAGFVSCRGNGICLIIKIDTKNHLNSFLGLEQYYLENYGLQVDSACKDVGRLRFASYDPDLYFNEKSQKWTKEYKNRKPKNIDIVYADSDIDFAVNQITSKKIDLTQDYQTWIELGMALQSTLGEGGLSYFHAISQYHPEYNPQQIDRKWRSFKGQKIGIGTFFYHCKKAGLEIVSPKTKHISTIATYGKANKTNPESVIKQLKVMDGISEKESEAIVKRVYDSNQKPEIDDDHLVEEIENYLKRQYDIKYNEITLKYEDSGKVMNDRSFNSIYLSAKKVIPKASKDLVFSLIESDITPIYNPVKEWFLNNYSNKPKGMITKLADTIISDTGFGESNDFNYVNYFLRKWMIGSVAMWHGEHSPLMLVLAGERQNTGKTQFFRRLLPNELNEYFAEAELNGDKDENLLMCSKIMIMNDEMSNKSKRDITIMKKLCSVQFFNLRKPYGKMSEDFKRIATLCGTSNNLELLSDPTGNRRIIPIQITNIRHDDYNEINKGDLWMEAFHAYKDGENYNLTNDDIKRLSESTNEFDEISLEAELIMKCFAPADAMDAYAVFKTTSEIKSEIEILTHQRLILKKLGMELKRLGYTQTQKRVNKIPVRGFYLTTLNN